MNRAAFLRLIGLGAAAAIVPREAEPVWPEPGALAPAVKPPLGEMAVCGRCGDSGIAAAFLTDPLAAFGYSASGYIPVRPSGPDVYAVPCPACQYERLCAQAEHDPRARAVLDQYRLDDHYATMAARQRARNRHARTMLDQLTPYDRANGELLRAVMERRP